eukprot:TRINITY_DN21070_c0_g1_i1.p1 TRINITY_DN21070_c0_g1~~TRINITY_DN21070_c0_g1_i1.p1  ORF type:complete len:227 (+),score=61.52 TRINITY_DN21070_c0_g1_i1:91-771(+)
MGADQRKLRPAQTKREADSSLSQRHPATLSNRESILELMRRLGSRGKENLAGNKRTPHSKTFRTSAEVNKKAIQDFIKKVEKSKKGNVAKSLFIGRRKSERPKNEPIEYNERNSVVMPKQASESNNETGAIAQIIRKELLREIGMNSKDDVSDSKSHKLKASIESLAKSCMQRPPKESSSSKSERYPKPKLQKANQEVQTDNMPEDSAEEKTVSYTHLTLPTICSV